MRISTHLKVLAATFLLLHPACLHNTKKTVTQWRWGGFGIHCPPLEVRKGIAMDTANMASLQKAQSYVERELKMKLFTTTPQANKPYILAHGETPARFKDRDPCKSSIGGERFFVAGFMGALFRYPRNGRIERFEAVVCSKLIRRAKHMHNGWSPDAGAVRHLRNLGVWGHFAHELLHPYMGNDIDFTHVPQTRTLMGDAPEITAIGDVTRGVFARIKRACR